MYIDAEGKRNIKFRCGYIIIEYKAPWVQYVHTLKVLFFLVKRQLNHALGCRLSLQMGNIKDIAFWDVHINYRDSYITYLHYLHYLHRDSYSHYLQHTTYYQ